MRYKAECGCGRGFITQDAKATECMLCRVKRADDVPEAVIFTEWIFNGGWAGRDDSAGGLMWHTITGEWYEEKEYLTTQELYERFKNRQIT